MCHDFDSEIGSSDEVAGDFDRRGGGSENRNESGTWRENGEKQLSPFKRRRKKGKKKGTQSKKPPFPFHTKKWKLVSLQGWVLLFLCFYSNSSYVLLLTDLESYYYAISKKNKNRQRDC